MKIMDRIRHQLYEVDLLIKDREKSAREFNDKLKIYGTIDPKRKDEEDFQEDGSKTI